MKVTAALSSLPPLMELMGGFGMAAALWYGAHQIASDRLSPGEFASFFGAVLLMYGPAKKLSRVNANLQQAMAASERIFEMLDTHTEVHEAPDAPALAPFARDIEFRDVGFGYEDGPRRDSPRRVVPGPRRPDGGDRRPQRRGQDDARQPAAALLRRDERRDPDRRRGPAAGDARLAARADRHRDAGDRAVRRHDRQQHRVRRHAARRTRRSRRRRAPRTRTSSSRAAGAATRR